ncbi:MAG: excinuclease ABC subunit UvrC, partial [Gammaproteobacteria bacterium]|nr:excinuclease ABC subunit UvrC [Gammaproteobacteria bacterium]
MPSSAHTFDSEHFLKHLSRKPGVYRMFDTEQKILYVGKAKNLKNRLSSYFRKEVDSEKTRLLVSQIQSIETTVTHTEAEALILEFHLIREHQPRYNILLRDGKGYPSIELTSAPYPRIAYHRGRRNEQHSYFGPYPNGHAVKQSLYLLQKLFQLRQCDDSFFNNRSRPCLQYQIKRCKAPCVGRISEQEYALDVLNTRLFLEGKSNQVVETFISQMETASQALKFEQAAHFRDQIRALKIVQERQYVSGERGNLDVVACHQEGGQNCVQLFFIRDGRNLGNKAFFPKTTLDNKVTDVLYAFLTQFYLQQEIPSEILLSHALQDQTLLSETFSQKAERKIKLSHKLRGERQRWMQMAVNNAKIALTSRLASRAGMNRRLQSLKNLLQLETLPQRMECFDISHTQGESTVASCVVFNAEGPLKSEYRRFNIKNITPGDDYAAMSQALQRRYSRLIKEESSLPEIIFVDGGKGQLSQAEAIIKE